MKVQISRPAPEATSGLSPRHATLAKRVAALATPRSVLMLVLIALLAYLVLPPLGVMVWKSFVGGASLSGTLGFDGYQSIAGSGLGVAVVDTLEFALGSTAVSMVVGTALAWGAVRTDAPLRSLAYVVAFLGLAVPGIVKVVGWILLFGNGNGQGDLILSELLGRRIAISVESLPGMIFVESLLSIPLVFFIMVGPLQSFNTSLEEAGTVHGARDWTVLRRVTAPLLLPAIASATLLIVIRSVQAFEVPVLLGVPAGAHIFTAELYQSLHSSLIPDYSSAAAYGTILVVALLVLASAENRLTRDARRFAVVTGRGGGAVRKRSRRTRYVPAVLNLVLLVCYLLPTVYLLFSSFERNLGGGLSWHNLTVANYPALWNSPGFTKAATNTLLVAAVTAVATVVITLAGAWVAARSRSRPARLVNLLANTPLVIPGAVFGLGILIFYLYSPVPLYGTLFEIILAFTALYLPYGMRSLRPAILSISTELEEAARVSGASQLAVGRRIVLPLVTPSAMGAALFVFFNAFRELAVAALVVTAATPLLATRLLDALVNGDLAQVSALGTFIMAVSLVIGVVAFRIVGLKRGAAPLTKEVG